MYNIYLISTGESRTIIVTILYHDVCSSVNNTMTTFLVSSLFARVARYTFYSGSYSDERKTVVRDVLL